jgi:hypothetical protein
MESAGARGVRVNVENNTNKGQTLLPWRLKTAAGLQLRTLLIRHVLATNLHMQDGKAGVNKLWDQLVDQLMMEPEFSQHITPTTAPLSGRNLRDQYSQIISAQCELHGWAQNGGTTGNLSGFEGELDELGRNVRQILMDKEEKIAKKEAEAADRADLEKKENDIISGETQRNADAARNKRKHAKIAPVAPGSAGSASTSSSGSPSDSSPWQALDEIIWGRQKKQVDVAEIKPKHRLLCPNQEPLKKYFAEHSMDQIAAELKIRRPEFAEDLEEIEEHAIRRQFHMARWEYIPFEKGMLSFGLKPLEAFKLFSKLEKLCDDQAEADEKSSKAKKPTEARALDISD